MHVFFAFHSLCFSSLFSYLWFLSALHFYFCLYFLFLFDLLCFLHVLCFFSFFFLHIFFSVDIFFFYYLSFLSFLHGFFLSVFSAEPVLKSNPTRRYEGSKSNLMPQPQTLATGKEANAVTRAEVSPYRRWSETSVDQKVSNEWQSNFERSYIELEELGRGRFSVVRRCQEIMSGNEVAVKFVNRRKQNEPDTLREYRHLAQIKNPHLISSFGLYLTSNSYAIVMTL